ncbi:MAG: peptidoglycan bridge formation glycyltransferase FemA/FemB family protein [Chloroflexota bacterium]|nr:peptidoglycan bridge formation glycyltransferase FemA/FemB family protein [Chloroflexota bacterium]
MIDPAPLNQHPAPRLTQIESQQGLWNDAVLAHSAQLLQSWEWGELKSRWGWKVERVAVEAGGRQAFAQVLLRHRGPLSIGYLPRGPVLGDGDRDLADLLFTTIDRRCRQHRAISLIVEPDRPLPFIGTLRDAGFVQGFAHIQPSRTVKVPLLEDEALLNQMHQKTRYNVRLAQRRGVVAQRAAPDHASFATFYGLLADTADRNAFGIHHAEYYADFMRAFGDRAILLFALIDGVAVAGLMAARFGPEAIYMYGASSTKHRAHGAGFFLQFEAMRWARDAGCSRYDLWGIPAETPASTEVSTGNRVAGTHGDDWRGLYEFKVRFGGEILAYPAALERRYVPVLSALARRVYRPGG